MLKNEFLSTDTTCEKLVRLQDNQTTGWVKTPSLSIGLGLADLPITGKRVKLECSFLYAGVQYSGPFFIGGIVTFAGRNLLNRPTFFVNCGIDPFNRNGFISFLIEWTGSAITINLTSTSFSGVATTIGSVLSIWTENSGDN